MAYLDGEYGAKIYCLAPKLEQANIVYDNFFQMIKKEPELSELSKSGVPIFTLKRQTRL